MTQAARAFSAEGLFDDATVGVLAPGPLGGKEAAAESLSRQPFIDAVRSIDDLPLAASRGPGSFGPDKGDAPDMFRLMQVDQACDCRVPQGDFAAG
jgi:hypothetical protein